MFFLFHELTKLGWNVKAEVWCPGTKGCKGSRYDLVVFTQQSEAVNQHSDAVRIIEVKKATPHRNAKVFLSDEFECWYLTDGKLNKQIPRYREHGIPVDVVVGKERAKQYVEWAKKRGTPERSETEPEVTIMD